MSSYYVDLACLLSSADDLHRVAEIAASEIKNAMIFETITKPASIGPKGALILPSIGYLLNLLCAIARKGKKAYGVTRRIVGIEITSTVSLLFFDDVVSKGLSKLGGIKPLEELGAVVKHLMVVVDRKQGDKEKLGYRIYSLADLPNCECLL